MLSPALGCYYIYSCALRSQILTHITVYSHMLHMYIELGVFLCMGSSHNNCWNTSWNPIALVYKNGIFIDLHMALTTTEYTPVNYMLVQQRTTRNAAFIIFIIHAEAFYFSLCLVHSSLNTSVKYRLLQQRTTRNAAFIIIIIHAEAFYFSLCLVYSSLTINLTCISCWCLSSIT